jgi:hypothetical protein
VTRSRGASHAPHVFVPQPLVGRSSAELFAYVTGKSPVTGRPVMEEVIAGLTRPVQADETIDRHKPRMLSPAPEDRLHEEFRARGFTDQLPIVLPTEERVQTMLGGTSRSPEEIVGRLAPASSREPWQFTVEKVAVNAVMAGAAPQYLPVILALASTGVTARNSSTTSLAGMAIVNGPVRDELGIGGGLGALGPYHHANVTIGRAWGLLSQNLQGGSAPGLTYMGSQGNAYAFTSCCFGENEEASPWEPLHVQHGFAPRDDVVSAFVGGRTTLFSLGLPEVRWKEALLRHLLACDAVRGPVLLLDPLVARRLVELGFEDKARLAEWVVEHARIPAGEFWELSLNKLAYLPRAAAGQEPWAGMLAAPADELVPMFQLKQVHTAVVGGETNATWRVMGHTLEGQARIDAWR